MFVCYIYSIETISKLSVKIQTHRVNPCKKGITIEYNHDIAYNIMKENLSKMNCFQKYKSYTASGNIPTMLRNVELV